MYIKLSDNEYYLDLINVKNNITLENFYYQIGDIINMNRNKFNIYYDYNLLSDDDIKQFIDDDELIIHIISHEEYLNNNNIKICSDSLDNESYDVYTIECLLKCNVISNDIEHLLHNYRICNETDKIYILLKYHYIEDKQYEILHHYAIFNKINKLIPIIMDKHTDILKYYNDNNIIIQIILNGCLSALKHIIDNGYVVTQLMYNKDITYYACITNYIYNANNNNVVRPVRIIDNLNIDMIKYITQFLDVLPHDTQSKQTCLHILCKHSNNIGNVTDALDVLLDHLDIDEQDHNGNTAIHLSAKHNNLKSFKFLYDSNANLNIKNRLNLNPVQIAIINNSLEIIKFINSTSIKINIPTLIFNRRIKIKMFEQLIINCGNPNIYKNDLHLLLYHCTDEKIEILLRHGLNINHRNKHNMTILHSCMHLNDISIIKLLIRNGADINTLSHNGTNMVSILKHAYDCNCSNNIILYLQSYNPVFM